MNTSIKFKYRICTKEVASSETSAENKVIIMGHLINLLIFKFNITLKSREKELD